jgi:nucleoside-diphosphate-sugar epimerase
MCKPAEVLVTGATGFLGSAIVRHALEHGLQVRALTRAEKPFEQGVVSCVGDILVKEELLKPMHGAHCVIHAAGLAHVFAGTALEHAPFALVNEQGTTNVMLVAAALGVPHVVLVSSVAVYGSSGGIRTEGSVCVPKGAYARSKLAAERVASAIASESGVRLTILRMATLYGEGDRGNVQRLIQAIDRGRFVWIGCGTNLKTLLYRSDAGKAAVSAAIRGGSDSEVFNVGSGSVTVRALVRTIQDALGRPDLRIRISPRLATACARGLGVAVPRFRDVSHSLDTWLRDDQYDSSRFDEAVPGWRKMSIEEGIRRQVAWYREHRG